MFKALCLTICIIALIGIIVISCKKDNNSASENRINSDNGIKELASQYFQPISSEGYKTWLTKYKSLSFDEMTTFNEQLANIAYDLVKDKEENAYQKIQLAKEMRNELNKLSMSQFKVPMNQLEYKHFEKLSLQLWNKSYSTKSKSIQSNLKSTENVNSCSCVSYPFSANWGGMAYDTNGQSTKWRSHEPQCNDCDLEVAYPPNKYTISWVTIAGAAYWDYVLYGGGRFIYRHTQYSTGVLIGNNAVYTIFLGVTDFAQKAYRMD